MTQETPIIMLLIEDDPQCARMLEKVLPEHGYAIHHASTGLDGLKLARTVNPQVILVDMGLPDLNGKIVVNQLRGIRSTQNIPIIAFTAESGDRAKRMALAFGCDGFISKPIDTHELPHQIASVMENCHSEGVNNDRPTHPTR